MCCTSYRYLMLFVLAGTSALYFFNWDHLFENPAKNDTSSEVGRFSSTGRRHGSHVEISVLACNSGQCGWKIAHLLRAGLL